jgi:1-acyl-sn-glycerol-3-phosphate acyltransferase
MSRPHAVNPTTRFPVRLARLARLAVHLFKGLIAAFHYPSLDAAGQNAAIRRWSRQLLAILNVKLDCHGEPDRLPDCCMLVSNHISWLDIFVIDAVLPSSFVSKSDVAGWPLIGWLCTRVGTLYIERGSKSGARRANHVIAQTLEAGRLVAVCPEGTTTFGRELLPFHAALFQPAVEAHATILPVVLSYQDEHGAWCKNAGYVGDDTLADSIWAIVSTPRMVATLRFAAPIAIEGMGRREVARAAEAVIAKELNVPVPQRDRDRTSRPS